MHNFRSNCPIGSALDLVGDKWSLLIVRDMLIFQKSTFKDFESSDEHIATNILSSRLKQLEASGLVTKHKLQTNKKTNVYLLTVKGCDLADTMMTLQVWSDMHLREAHPEMNDYKVGRDRRVIDKKTGVIVAGYSEFRDLQLSLCV